MQATFFKKSPNFFRCLPGRSWPGWSKKISMDGTCSCLAAYGAIVGFGVWHHEAWSDEAYPWMIARDADWRSFLEIILTNRDRHPGLFYIALLPLARWAFRILPKGS